MIVVAILICAFPPVGILALLIYIFIKDHAALAESIYTTIFAVALGIVLITSPFTLLFSIISDVEQKTASWIACGIFTLIDIAICIFALAHIVSKRKHTRVLRSMDMVSVKSTEISHIGYKDGTLYVRMVFNGGCVYSYLEVPENEYESLKSAASIDCYFTDYIKGKYKCIKI